MKKIFKVILAGFIFPLLMGFIVTGFMLIFGSDTSLLEGFKSGFCVGVLFEVVFICIGGAFLVMDLLFN